MHKTTTSTNNQKDVMTSVKGPKKATIALLKQSASVYEYNVKSPRGLEPMIFTSRIIIPSPLRNQEAFPR